MREVAVIGIGQTKVEEHWDKSLRELAGDAALAAIMEAQVDHVDSVYVGNMLSGVANAQAHLGSMIADWIGQRFTDAVKIETACSSGGAAFRAGYIAVASGEVEIALVVGVENASRHRHFMGVAGGAIGVRMGVLVMAAMAASCVKASHGPRVPLGWR